MSTITYKLKRNDTVPVIVLDVLNSDGDPYDLSDATSADFIMVTDDDARTEKVHDIDGADIASPGTLGRLTYQFSTADTDTAGKYLAEFQVTFSTGDKATFPESGYLHIDIDEDLDDA